MKTNELVEKKIMKYTQNFWSIIKVKVNQNAWNKVTDNLSDKLCFEINEQLFRNIFDNLKS